LAEQIGRFGNDVGNVVGAATQYTTGGRYGAQFGNRDLDPSLPIAALQIPVALGAMAIDAVRNHTPAPLSSLGTMAGFEPPDGVTPEVQAQALAAKPTTPVHASASPSSEVVAATTTAKTPDGRAQGGRV
jgi:hypothetical protein